MTAWPANGGDPCSLQAGHTKVNENGVRPVMPQLRGDVSAAGVAGASPARGDPGHRGLPFLVEPLEPRLLLSGGALEGQVFWDRDFDTAVSGTDVGLAGWTVFLDQNRNGALDAGEASTLTGVNGAYRFDNLAAGTYYPKTLAQAGWGQPLLGLGGGDLYGFDFLNGQLVNPRHVSVSNGNAPSGVAFGPDGITPWLCGSTPRVLSSTWSWAEGPAARTRRTRTPLLMTRPPRRSSGPHRPSVGATGRRTRRAWPSPLVRRSTGRGSSASSIMVLLHKSC